MGRPVNRADQRLKPEDMKTFQIKAPEVTHFRTISCEQAECKNYLRGWRMVIDLNTDLGRQQGRYIKYSAGRSYEVTDQREGLVELEFAKGQPCFERHQARVEEIPAVFVVKDGDYRGNPRGTPARVHTRAEHWVEEFAENQDWLRTNQERRG